MGSVPIPSLLILADFAGLTGLLDCVYF
jgi:hypothetical protein